MHCFNVQSFHFRWPSKEFGSLSLCKPSIDWYRRQVGALQTSLIVKKVRTCSLFMACNFYHCDWLCATHACCDLVKLLAQAPCVGTCCDLCSQWHCLADEWSSFQGKRVIDQNGWHQYGGEVGPSDLGFWLCPPRHEVVGATPSKQLKQLCS